MDVFRTSVVCSGHRLYVQDISCMFRTSVVCSAHYNEGIKLHHKNMGGKSLWPMSSKGEHLTVILCVEYRILIRMLLGFASGNSVHAQYSCLLLMSISHISDCKLENVGDTDQLNGIISNLLQNNLTLSVVSISHFQ